MICCKITTNFNSDSGNFTKLLEKLSQFGDVIWENSMLFFADTDHQETSEKKVSNILKNCGYKQFYICSYDKNNQPNETEYITGWLCDRLMKINKTQYEIESQKIFRQTMVALDALDKQIEDLQTNIQKEEDSCHGGRNEESN